MDELRPRLLRPVAAPLGLYLRPGRNDHQKLLDMLAEGRASCSGFALDAALNERHTELREEAVRLGFEAVLDPRVGELATEGGFASAPRAALPWAPEAPHRLEDLRDTGGTALVEGLAEFIAANRYNAMLAPTHLIQGSDDEWLSIDANLVLALRRRLDTHGLTELPIYYPLVISTTTLRDNHERARMIEHLTRLPIGAVWLRISPFGATSGPRALTRYIEGATELQRIGVPVIAERTGTAGLPLLAFGAVGGIEGGITMGERFDAGSWTRRPNPNSKPFARPPRVYVPRLGLFMSRKQTSAFFENRQMKALLACKDDHCCRRGIDDMLADPRRHFVIQRSAEVAQLSRAPGTLRPQLYMDDFLRPATDLVLQAARVDPSLLTSQRRLESWRIALGTVIRAGISIPTDVAVPSGRRIIRAIGA